MKNYCLEETDNEISLTFGKWDFYLTSQKSGKKKQISIRAIYNINETEYFEVTRRAPLIPMEKCIIPQNADKKDILEDDFIEALSVNNIVFVQSKNRSISCSFINSDYDVKTAKKDEKAQYIPHYKSVTLYVYDEKGKLCKYFEYLEEPEPVKTEYYEESDIPF